MRVAVDFCTVAVPAGKSESGGRRRKFAGSALLVFGVLMAAAWAWSVRSPQSVHQSIQDPSGSAGSGWTLAIWDGQAEYCVMDWHAPPGALDAPPGADYLYPITDIHRFKVPFWTAAAVAPLVGGVLLWFGRRAGVRAWRLTNRHCLVCGYDASRLPGGSVCPECGRAG